MTKTRAFIGDIHGCYEEFQQLLDILKAIPVDEIWLAGDLVDRGPDSGKVIQIAIDNRLKSVMGNHENSIINHYKRYKEEGVLPNKGNKRDTILQMTDTHYDYIKELPHMQVFDDQNIVLVHGGLWPFIPLYQQPPAAVIRAQLIYPYDCKRQVRWWGPEATKHSSGKTEEESRAEGYRRWYEVYDGAENVIYGHSVFVSPYLHQNEGAGWTCGIDTGNVFGGNLTAAVCVGKERPYFIGVPPKKVYCEDKLGQFLPR